jgi:hypothetical protein
MYLRCVSPAPWTTVAASGTVEFSGPRGVNAESLNIVTKNDLIIQLIETRIWAPLADQIINRLII